MTLHYCEVEKSASICGEIGEGVPDLVAASRTSDALTALAGACVCRGLHILTFPPGSESILATRWIYVWDAVLMLTLESVKYMSTPGRATELHIQIYTANMFAFLMFIFTVLMYSKGKILGIILILMQLLLVPERPC